MKGLRINSALVCLMLIVGSLLVVVCVVVKSLVTALSLLTTGGRVCVWLSTPLPVVLVAETE